MKLARTLATLAALAAITTGCAATDSGGGSGSGGGGNQPPGLNADQGHPNRVKAGQRFRLGDFRVHKGWRVHRVGFGMGYEVQNLVVENLTGDDHSFSVNIKLHAGPHRIVSNINCFAQEAHPHDVVNVDCVPDGSGRPWKFVTIENSL